MYFGAQIDMDDAKTRIVQNAAYLTNLFTDKGVKLTRNDLLNIIHL